MLNPINETRRIRDDLVKCGLPYRWINKSAVKEFVREDLQISLNTAPRDETHTEGQACIIPGFKSEALSQQERAMENKMFKAAMQVYCDMKSRKAFNHDYIWPDLEATEKEINANFTVINPTGHQVIGKAMSSNGCESAPIVTNTESYSNHDGGKLSQWKKKSVSKFSRSRKIENRNTVDMADEESGGSPWLVWGWHKMLRAQIWGSDL